MVETAQLQSNSDLDTVNSLTSPSSLPFSLVQHLSKLPQRRQLFSLASCIGFDIKDITPDGFRSNPAELEHFTPKLRIQFIKESLYRSRVDADYHALGLEEARFRGKLVPHISSVVVQDDRSNTFQMLSVGEAELSVNKCSQLWQGETSTIIPMSAIERKGILDTAKNWILEDLNVVAFTYAPVPYAFESWNTDEGVVYLIDSEGVAGSKNGDAKPSASAAAGPGLSSDEDYWKLTKNQIFLGLLGSTSGPRKEIAPFIKNCNSAGIRFVFFSPRNMRRSKELASKLGLEMGWNCAISLRALKSDQDHDEHRMISSYADWDVNAKLPHGIEEIRRHLVDVDNVPLLVSLFTDATNRTTKEMVGIFREHNDTVLILGCSHLSKNTKIFGSSDISVGVDVFEEEFGVEDVNVKKGLELASSVITQDCLFNIPITAVPNIMDVIAMSRAAYECSISASQFVLCGSMGMAFLSLLCLSTPDKQNMYISGSFSIFYLLLLVPSLAVGIAFGGADSSSMNRCPVKNDAGVVFSGRDELFVRSTGVIGRALLNAAGAYTVGILANGQVR